MGEYVYILEVTVIDSVGRAGVTHNAGQAFKTRDAADSKKKELEDRYRQAGLYRSVCVLELPLLG